MIPRAARHYRQYQHDDISTSNQGQLILMMYEGAVKNAFIAIDCIDNGDLAGKGKHIRKIHDIINELSLSLDMDKGGDISKRLERLYQFILSQLTLANIKSDPKALKNVLGVLKILLEAWSEVVEMQKVEKTPSPEKTAKTITAHC